MTEDRSLTPKPEKNSRESSAKGGRVRAQRLTPEERSAIAREGGLKKAGKARALAAGTPDALEVVGAEDDVPAFSPEWLPVADYKGVLPLMDLQIPCYVLSDGRRVIGRTSATEMLTEIKGGGAFEKYVGVTALRPFINIDRVTENMVQFRLPEVEGIGNQVRGLPADQLIEVCQGFVAALDAHSRPEAGVKLTSRQISMAMRASQFLAACAKVGLDALIDEATGFQYDREHDALRVKLKAYLEVEMRKWEKTFPDELWQEFGRLTNWTRSVTQRPKYWGHLVNELVYDYMDPDVAKWLRENAPTPRHGQNYHQWLSSQYGLQKLVEHIWKLVGIAKTCLTMRELQDRMAELYGRRPIQLRLYVPMTPKD